MRQHVGQAWLPFAGACTVMLGAVLLMAQAPVGGPPGDGPPGGRGGGGKGRGGGRGAPPAFQMVKGQPIDTREPEKKDDHPAFPGQTRAPYEPTAAPKVTLLTDKLNNPWSIAFLPDGKFLITEKPGTMRTFNPKDNSLSEPLAGVPKVHYQGQVGLLDLALDPQFASNRRIFFSYMEDMGDDDGIVLASAKLAPDDTAITGAAVVFRATAVNARMHGANRGGRIAIGRDGNIFMTVGDGAGSPPWDMAQKLDNTIGKIIHITPDGKPAPGNPFIGKAGAAPEIWSYGHRSEEGLTINPDYGRTVGDRAWPARRRQAHSAASRQELRLAGVRSRHRLSRHHDRRGNHGSARHGAAGVLLGPGDRAVRAWLSIRAICFPNGRTASSWALWAGRCSTG